MKIANYESVLKSLKDNIRAARQKASIVVNEQLLILYWEIGHTILQQQSAEGWGTKVIKRLAVDLKSEFPDMKGFSERNLKYMRSFAEPNPRNMKRLVNNLALEKASHIISGLSEEINEDQLIRWGILKSRFPLIALELLQDQRKIKEYNDDESFPNISSILKKIDRNTIEKLSV